MYYTQVPLGTIKEVHTLGGGGRMWTHCGHGGNVGGGVDIVDVLYG